MTVQAIAKIIRETVDADMSQRLHKVDEAATAILALLSALQDRDVGAHKCDAEDGYPCTTCGQYETDWGVVAPPSVAVPEGWQLVPKEPSPEQLKFFGYAPGDYASKCFRCQKIVEWLDKRASCCLPCAQAAYQKYLAHFGSASPSPVVDAPIATGERLGAEEKEMFRLADRLGYVCTPEPHPDSPHVQEQEETLIAIKDEAREEAAKMFDGLAQNARDAASYAKSLYMQIKWQEREKQHEDAAVYIRSVKGQP